MSIFSSDVRSRIQPYGKVTREIQQRGIPFNVPLGLPIVNPFSRKHLLFKARYKISGVTLEDVREGIFFASFRRFMDIKMETYCRSTRTRHFRINPFTKKLEEILGPKFGKMGIRTGDAVADFMVNMLGLVEWEMSEDPGDNPDLVSIHVKLTSKYFGGYFKFRIHRQPDGVILDDDWLPEGGGDVWTSTLPMGNLVLTTHPLGFEQIAERIVEEILAANGAGKTYKGEIGPPSEELK
jgi:hypothetical protein